MTIEDALDAIEALKASGFPAQDISLLMKDRGKTKDMAEDAGTQVW